MLDRVLPSKVAYDMTRWKNVLLGMAFFNFSRRYPARAKKMVVNEVRKTLGPDFDVETHFTPRYGVWDQRVCLAPDGDFFTAMREGRVDIVTDHIESFTESGLELQSGKRLDADLVVSATGLKLLLLGDVQLTVDGERVDVGKTMNYRGTMLSDVPNLAIALGYTNASWTLKCDLVCEYVCRLLNHMQENGYDKCVARVKERSAEEEEPLLDFTSGYVQRSIALLPKQGKKAPWRLYQNYFLDLLGLRYGGIEDGVLELSRTR